MGLIGEKSSPEGEVGVKKLKGLKSVEKIADHLDEMNEELPCIQQVPGQGFVSKLDRRVKATVSSL